MKGCDSNIEEIEVNRGYTYEETVLCAATALGIHSDDRAFALYKSNTARIHNAELLVKSKNIKWTVGNYLLHVKKGPSQVKFGVGYEDFSHNDCKDIIIYLLCYI